MRALVLVVASVVSLLSGCGTPVGQCAASQSTQLTASDGVTVTCQCKGACGCFFEDGGRCPQ